MESPQQAEWPVGVIEFARSLRLPSADVSHSAIDEHLAAAILRCTWRETANATETDIVRLTDRRSYQSLLLIDTVWRKHHDSTDPLRLPNAGANIRTHGYQKAGTLFAARESSSKWADVVLGDQIETVRGIRIRALPHQRAPAPTPGRRAGLDPAAEDVA